MSWLLVQASLLCIAGVYSLNFNDGVIVHLFEWKYSDIAQECEEFLGPRGFKGVQISPPSENLVLPGRPWSERYQPVSYNLTTRSGTKEDLANMLTRCNNVGVGVFADTVINHMTTGVENCYGTANSSCNAKNYSYPAVPYKTEHFNQPPCSLSDYGNATEIRVCELLHLHDLNQTKEYVRQKIVDFMNGLIDLGVAGFRIDAAKHMFHDDLAVIYSRLHNLNTSHGFPSNTKPFIYQEVPSEGKAPEEEYIDIGLVTEFYYGKNLSHCFMGKNDLKWLYNFGTAWGFIPSNRSLVFVENHDKERDTNNLILNYKNPVPYKMAVAFMLSWNYGIKKIMSSFDFSNIDQGPPHDSHEQIISQRPIVGNICSNGWVCQHRWRQVVNMVAFHNVVAGTDVSSWWDNGKNQIAFCRGNKGFIAFNLEANQILSQQLQTCLPKGTYCDIISGNSLGFMCTGRFVEVNDDGTAHIFINKFDPNSREDGVLALHVEASIKNMFDAVILGK